jgi:hypothetical protein
MRVAALLPGIHWTNTGSACPTTKGTDPNTPEAMYLKRGKLCDQVHCCLCARCLWLSLDVNQDRRGRKVRQGRKENRGRKVRRGPQGPRENQDPRAQRGRWDLLGHPEQRLPISMWFAGMAQLRAIRAGK